ncbi:hypothetical protein ACI782_18070 [Geodermatophilus sp. SYSU D00703]
MTDHIEGRGVVITGAGSGAGRASAVSLARERGGAGRTVLV